MKKYAIQTVNIVGNERTIVRTIPTLSADVGRAAISASVADFERQKWLVQRSFDGMSCEVVTETQTRYGIEVIEVNE